MTGSPGYFDDEILHGAACLRSLTANDADKRTWSGGRFVFKRLIVFADGVDRIVNPLEGNRASNSGRLPKGMLSWTC